MNSVNKMISEVTQLVSGNSIYTNYAAQWKYLLQSYMGGKEYREAGLLNKYALENENEYQARLMATPVQNHCASVISVYTSFLFREQPTRELGSLVNDPVLEDFLNDADQDGRSLDSFMKDVSIWASVYGHCWIVLAKPNTGAITKADEMALGARPYCNLITPLSTLDWEWERTVSGKYALSYLKYIEDINGDVRIVKEWTNDTITTSTVNVAEDSMLDQVIEVNELGTIPAIIAYNTRSPLRGLGVSDITDIADAQRFIYNATSEIDQSIRLDSHPSLVKTPETNMGVGAGAIINMPDNLDPALKPYVLDFGGANTTNILAAINHTIASIDKMANVGAVRTTESKVMSGVAMETEFQLHNARLSSKADHLELAEEQLWKLWALYQGQPWTGKVTYPGSFNIRDTQSEIEQLGKARAASTSAIVHNEIDKKILEFLGVEDVEITVTEPIEQGNE